VRIPSDYYLIIDVEATCCDAGAVPRHEMEIIEIGALIQSSRTFEIESEFQTFVRPVRHPELTEFCKSLTGITQREVTGGPRFAEALEKMKLWISSFPDSLFCSWGDYDRNQFQQDCDFHRITYPFPAAHLNLKARFSSALGLRKQFGIGEALRHLGMEFVGSHHRGLDDARNIARIVRHVRMPGS
jgi:inhibitor of KinA sporulation pathway (predicted exonuclease)